MGTFKRLHNATATRWRNYSVARTDGLAWGSEIAAGILPETFCARSVSRLTITCHRAEPRRQMSRCGGRRRQLLFPSGKHSVPWSSLWQRVILASSTSGPGWSSTCLHHCRGLRMPSSCSSALGLTYNLAWHKTKSAVQSGCLTPAEAVTSSGKTMKRIYVFCKLALCDVTKPTDPARCSFHPLGSPSTKQDLCTNKPIRASVLARR